MQRILAILLVSALVSPLGSSHAQEQPPDDPPRRTGMVERTGVRLVQVDVTLTGPQKTLDELTLQDFRVKVGGKKITDFEVDRVCRDGTTSASLGSTTAGGFAAPEPDDIPAPTLGPTTFLIYFDQPHLTMAGRQDGIDLVRELIPRIVVDGNRALLVSNAARLETIVDLTDDADELLEGLNRLERDRDQWDLFAELEVSRIEEVLDHLGIGSNANDFGAHGDFQRALTLAKLYYQDELWRAERDLRRFSMVLGRLSQADQPKIVLYLADNMRSNAGEHYLDLFGEFARREVAEQVETSDWMAAGGQAMQAMLPFDQVVNMASAHGVRLYTVQAEGLPTSTQGAPTTRRFRHAQNTLSDLAAETGGRAFLNGVRAEKIAERFEQDLSCLYLVSFKPDDLELDRGLRVVIEVDKPRVKTRVRGRITIQSESSALTSRLLAAFADPSTMGGSIAVQPTVIPTGYEDGAFLAMVQVAVPGSEFPASTWDLGASVVSRGNVREASGRLTVGTSNARIVLQQQMSFSPGPYEIVAVAHNTTSDLVSSQQIEGDWPRPNAELASVGPIAVLQPTRAAIQRDDEVKTSGFVAYAEEEPVRTDEVTMVLAVVCKSSDVKGTLNVERSLEGSSSVDFDPQKMDLGKESCALIRDLVPAETMTSGTFRYRIRVLDKGTELASGQRRFFAWDGQPLEPSEAPAEPDGA